MKTFRAFFFSMIYKFILFSSLIFLSSCGYTLLWSDEFEGNTLDANSWTVPEYDNPQNNEMQAYTKASVYVAGGYLHLVAKKQDWGKQHYTSGKVVTENKRDFLYGKFEARMKMPAGKGMWPAFWMMPTNLGQYWPTTGEIDIMETVGNDPTNTHSTLHYGTSVATHKWKGDPYAVPGGYSNAFHVYTCEWEPTKITFYVDGVLYSTRTPSEIQPWPFTHKFYIILNLAVGGDWPGAPDGSTIFPSEFLIDYVRVYQGSADVPTSIVQSNKDINGNDLKSVSGGSWKDCFTPCYSTAGCQSFTWSNYNGGTCWLKTTTDKSFLTSKDGVYSGFVCGIRQDMDIVGNDVGSQAASNARDCCSYCAQNSKCNAFSWSSFQGGTCWLKSGGTLTQKTGIVAWSG